MPLGKKKDGRSGSANPLWFQEPDHGDGMMGLHSSGMSLSSSYHTQMNGGFGYQSGSQDLPPYVVQPAGLAVYEPATQMRQQMNFSTPQMQQWSGQQTPPINLKRKNKKKKEKKEKKKSKDKKRKDGISGPLDPRHVGGMQNIMHLNDPMVQQSKFNVEFLTVMPVEGQLRNISPLKSIRKVKDLFKRGDIEKVEVLLSISPTEIIIKDGSTRSDLTVIPIDAVTGCNYLEDSKGSIFMLTSYNPATSQPRMHFFQSSMIPAETINNEIQIAIATRKRQRQEESRWRLQRGGITVEQNLSENWVLGPRSTSLSSLPPRPTMQPPSPPGSMNDFSPLTSHGQSPSSPPPPSQPSPAPPPSQPHPSPGPNASNSPALPGDYSGRRGGSEFPQAASHHAGGSIQTLNSQDDHSHRTEELVSKYVSNVHAKPQKSAKVGSEIKRTMKASRIQRDVDIVNHVIDDLEAFMERIRVATAAWNDLEKLKGQKSRRKKQAAVLEALKKKSEPPSETEFIRTYQKCKYGINLIAKLGHHLSSPTPGELVKGIFVYLRQLVHINKGNSLASAVVTPLFTRQACDLLSRKLQAKDQELWNALGGNWIITIDQWPPGRPIPEYHIEFTDGCIPSNLHNASDCPANFPTLDTLPHEQRGPNYSDAYDGDLADGESSGLLINPAVMQAVASKAAMVSTPILPGSGARRPSDAGVPQSLRGLHSHSGLNMSQQSLTSLGSQETDVKMAKVLYDYSASALEELSVHRGEKVEVLDDSRNWWQVKNKFGATGYVASNMLEVIVRRQKNIGASGQENTINFHGRQVPPPPNTAPPSLPSPGSRHGNRQSPQMSGHPKKGFQPQMLSPLMETSESRTSTISRPAPPPNVQPQPPVPPGVPQPLGAPGPQEGAPVPPPPPGGDGAVPPPPPGPGGAAAAPPPPPAGPGGAPPPPPPPPPVQVPQKQTSLSDMLAQHKLKTAKEGKSSQKKLLEKTDGKIDIAAALKTRKPLRKTSTALALEGITIPANDANKIKSEFQRKMEARRLSSLDEPDGAYSVLPWKADNGRIRRWMRDQGYGDVADNVRCVIGEQMYKLSRDELKEMVGANVGIRLFGQLQKDKARAEKEGGAAKESEFQKLMRTRKTAADYASSREGTLRRGWGNKGQTESEMEDDDMPKWKRDLIRKKREQMSGRETVLDDTLPRGRRRDRSRRDDRYSRNYSDDEGGRRKKRYSDDYSDDRKGRRRRQYSENYSDDERGRRKWKDSRDQGRRKHKHERKHSRSRKDSHSRGYSDEEDNRRDRSRKKSRSRKDSKSRAYSDEEDNHKGRKSRSKSRRGSRSDGYSDDSRDRKGSRKRRESYASDGEERKKGRRRSSKKRGPTNVDDFDLDDYSDTSESYSSSENSDSDYSESASNSDDSGRGKKKMKSSASASELTNATWALGPTAETDDLDERIKTQQAEIKKQLSVLAETQKKVGAKSLQVHQHTMLQQDLQKLEQLQTKLKNNEGDQTLQMQLLGQQTLLIEHLKEIVEELTGGKNDTKSRVGEGEGGVEGEEKQQHQQHVLQQQQLQQAFADHQRQLLYEQQRQLEAEQQRQLLLAAEQQRQLQMAQLSSMQSPTVFMSPRSPYGHGLTGLSAHGYSPYAGTVGYY